MSCHVSLAATDTAMPPLIFAPALGYISGPDVRVRGEAPAALIVRLVWGRGVG